MWKELSAERLYSFRNSLVHFFGLGEEKEGVYMALAPNNLPDQLHDKWQKEFLKRGKRTVVIRSQDFYDLVREGAILMLGEWQDIIKQAQTNRKREQDYVDGIKRVRSKIEKEGAVRVEYTKQ